MVQIGRVRQCASSVLFGIAMLAPSAAGQGKTVQTVIVRVEPPDRKVLSSEVEVKADGKRLNVRSVSDPSTMPLNVAFVIDAGPDQSRVLGKEKDLALAIVNALPVPVSKLLVVRAGYRHIVYPGTADRAEATHLIQSLVAEEGTKSGIPIFEAMAAATGELSRLPGMPVLLIIAEGNDYGSSIGYKGLRDLVQAQSAVCLVALVDDHPTRGTKSILRYGWSLQDLANDTAGAFIENSRKVPRTATRLAKMIASFRLVTFEIRGLSPGRHRVSVSTASGFHLHVQKAVVISSRKATLMP
jgi:hypothetical protein